LHFLQWERTEEDEGGSSIGSPTQKTKHEWSVPLGVCFTKKIMTNLCYRTYRQGRKRAKHDLLGSNGNEEKVSQSHGDTHVHGMDNFQ